MPNLQVRELPTDIYGALADAARQEHRSLAQQAVVVLQKGLGLAEDPRERRRRGLHAIADMRIPNADELPAPEALVREDRDR